jgi:hypothetical protein
MCTSFSAQATTFFSSRKEVKAFVEAEGLWVKRLLPYFPENNWKQKQYSFAVDLTMHILGLSVYQETVRGSLNGKKNIAKFLGVSR